ncbi:MAG: phosphoglycerate kinase [Candidatus Peribacteraceae bacterium]|nr:phosphoglycerate kinase [Candidatus Peribacteraceae bacterium]
MTAGKIRSVTSANLAGKLVLVRVDHNVTNKDDGTLKNDEKIQATIPTLELLLNQGARLILMTHVGRPKGKPDPKLSTVTVAKHLETLLKGVSVTHIGKTVGPEVEKAAKALKNGQILYLENVRFHPEEEGEPQQQAAFGKQLAALAEAYVNEAFASCHEYEEASTCAAARLLPAYAGMYLEKEVSMLGKVLQDPARPLVLIISGAKMETKIPVIERFLTTGDDILLGGCIANTFIAAKGFDVGTSKYEPESIEKAQEIMLESKKEGCATIHVPRDVIVATEAVDGAEKLCLPVEDIEGDMSIFDIGKVTVERYKACIAKAKTIIWNGPLGLYEINRFSHASKRIAEAVAEATARGAYTVIGGGDTIDFHVRYEHSLDAYSFVSTGGGAMLEFIGGRPFPAIEALKR